MMIVSIAGVGSNHMSGAPPGTPGGGDHLPAPARAAAHPSAGRPSGRTETTREAMDSDRTKTASSSIAGWLKEVGLAQYAHVFVENAIDTDVLFDLTESDLENLGIPLGDRKRILKAIAAHEHRSAPRAGTPAPAVASLHAEPERRHLTVLF